MKLAYLLAAAVLFTACGDDDPVTSEPTPIDGAYTLISYDSRALPAVLTTRYDGVPILIESGWLAVADTLYEASEYRREQTATTGGSIFDRGFFDRNTLTLTSRVHPQIVPRTLVRHANGDVEVAGYRYRRAH